MVDLIDGLKKCGIPESAAEPLAQKMEAYIKEIILFNSAYNLIEQMIELDSKRDPEIESVAKELIDLKKDIEHIKDYAEKLYEKTREENVYLLSKDFEKYINEKKQEIKKELENEKK